MSKRQNYFRIRKFKRWVIYRRKRDFMFYLNTSPRNSYYRLFTSYLFYIGRPCLFGPLRVNSSYKKNIKLMK
ncbi:hypothetical protein [Sulfurimonas sp. NWX367]|uniref:hypothetical protein n=1 Tax=Sulfurimonas sp. NWX367 TaxID=2925413 RepID=UPI003204C8E3